jgi:hypothetical protein
MRIRPSIFIASVMVLGVLFTYFGLFIAPAISFESIDQERTLCIEDCKYRFWPVGSDWRSYFKCLDDCEKKMWKQWQKEMDELEKD